MRFMLFIFLLFLAYSTTAQSNVQLEIEHFSTPKIANATLDTNLFNIWEKRVIQTCESFFLLEKGNMDIVVVVVLPKENPTRIKVSSRPQLPAAKAKGLEHRLLSLSRPPYSALVDYSFVIQAKINAGCDNPQLKFLPQVLMPDEKIQVEYEAADLETKIKLTKEWVISEVIPIISYYQVYPQNKSTAVQKMGDYLLTKEYLRLLPADLTTQNEYYWRAINDVESGDGLIFLSKIFMHIVHDEFDLAKRFLSLGTALPEEDSLINYYYTQLEFRLDWLFDDLKNEILKGKSWQQQGDYHGAELHFEEVLKVMPKSAELLFEKYYSHSLLISHRSPEEIIDLWKECSEKVYAADPLFAMNIATKNKEEMYYLSLRHELTQILRDKNSVKKNLLKFADNALDLKVYGVAAEVYSAILRKYRDKYPDRDIEAYYLYCMNELGLIPKNYEEDITKERFKKIEKDRKKIMDNNPLMRRYKNTNTKNKNRKDQGKTKTGKKKKTNKPKMIKRKKPKVK